MAQQKKLHLTAMMRPVSLHTGSWRYPGAYPDANFNYAHLKSFAKKLEEAKFDAFFMADQLGVLDMPLTTLMRTHSVTSFEPFTLLSALSIETRTIGLVATASTTYDEPYHIARRFASLDHISNGRAAWNIVTTSNIEAGKNFGRDEHMEHSDRYKRAREFYDVVTGLWDSFDDDAFLYDQESGKYFDPDKLHILNHKGDELKVKGPLTLPRPVQGWPVIFQAGQSEPGRQLAAETAEAVFCSPGDIKAAKAIYSDIKGRADAAGRDPNHIKIFPAAFVVIGDTVEEAKAKHAKLDSLVHYDSLIAFLSFSLGFDASSLDPDSPLPEDLPETNASKTFRDMVLKLSEDSGRPLTVRELAERFGVACGLAFVGTPETIANQWAIWLEEEAADGFTLCFPFLPEGLDNVTQKLIPELQRRGLFRKVYKGNTLREHLGLPRPKNRFFT